MPDILDAVPEIHRDLIQSPLTATLTTIGPAEERYTVAYRPRRIVANPPVAS
jgi:hypothetical protein